MFADRRRAEATFSTIKVEYVHRHQFRTRTEARLKIATWITDFYNPRRRRSCGVPILSQARDLGIVRSLAGDGVLKMNTFKLPGTVSERVQVGHAGGSRWETKCQVTGSAEFSARTPLIVFTNPEPSPDRQSPTAAYARPTPSTVKWHPSGSCTPRPDPTRRRRSDLLRYDRHSPPAAHKN
jgi:hypothetical protein